MSASGPVSLPSYATVQLQYDKLCYIFYLKTYKVALVVFIKVISMREELRCVSGLWPSTSPNNKVTRVKWTDMKLTGQRKATFIELGAH